MSRDSYWTYTQGPELFSVGNTHVDTATVATERGWARVYDLAGTASSSGTTVTGTNTKFTTELVVGRRILVGNQERTVTAIASDTSLTTNSAFNPTLSGATVLRVDEIVVAIGELLSKKIDVTVVPTFSLALPANANYTTGQTLTFTVTASEAVVVEGAPTIGLTIGSTARSAVYDSAASTGTSLVFKYKVVTGDQDTNGIAVNNTITLGTSLDNVKDAIIGGGVAIAPASLTFTVGTTSGILVNNP